MSFNKGDIIWVSMGERHPSRLKHPAVVWQNDIDEESDFYGVMLTHSEPSKIFDNILMLEEHFESDQGFVYSNTHFVNQLLIKFQSWGPFNIEGCLTESGINFIEDKLTKTEPISFIEYTELIKK